MTGERPERLGPWFPNDISHEDWEELRRLSSAIELSGHTLDWYGGRDLHGNHVFEALVLTVEEKQQLNGESDRSKIKREKRNSAQGLPLETGAPDVKTTPLPWIVFREQAGVSQAPRLVDAISAAVRVKLIEVDGEASGEPMAAV